MCGFAGGGACVCTSIRGLLPALQGHVAASAHHALLVCATAGLPEATTLGRAVHTSETRSLTFSGLLGFDSLHYGRRSQCPCS